MYYMIFLMILKANAYRNVKKNVFVNSRLVVTFLLICPDMYSVSYYFHILVSVLLLVNSY